MWGSLLAKAIQLPALVSGFSRFRVGHLRYLG